MDFLTKYKKIIILSVVPFILSIFNCYIYLSWDNLLFGIIPLSWRIIITAVMLFAFLVWPLMADDYGLFDQNMNPFFRVILALVYCYGATIVVHIAMIAIYWVITLAGAAIYVVFSIIKFIFGIFS